MLGFHVSFVFTLVNKKTNMAESKEQFPLHECIFLNNVRKLSSLLRNKDVAEKDKYGKSWLSDALSSERAHS